MKHQKLICARVVLPLAPCGRGAAGERGKRRLLRKLYESGKGCCPRTPTRPLAARSPQAGRGSKTGAFHVSRVARQRHGQLG